GRKWKRTTMSEDSALAVIATAADGDHGKHKGRESLTAGEKGDDDETTAAMAEETIEEDAVNERRPRQQHWVQPIRSSTISHQTREASSRLRRSSHGSCGQATTTTVLQPTQSFGDGHGFACFNDNDERNAGQGQMVVNGAAAEKDDFEVRWEDGEDEVGNPRSMSRLRKWMIVLIVSTSSACVYVAFSSISITITIIITIITIVATLGLSLFVMGLGLGPMILGPLSEASSYRQITNDHCGKRGADWCVQFYGRKPIYVVSFTFFLIWLIPCAVARNIQTMLVARFLDGLAGSAFLSVAGGTIGDMFNRSELQAPMMVYSASPFIGPPIGPIVGGFINYFTTWRWTFYVLLIWATVELALIMIVIPETYHPVLLKRKAIALRGRSGDGRWRAPIEQLDLSLMQKIIQSIYRPFLLLTLEPMCLNLCLFSAVLLGVLYLFFGAFEIVFEENHDFNLWYAGLLVGMVFAIAMDPLWHRNYVRLIRNGESNGGEKGGAEPEYRLPPAIAGVFSGVFTFLVDAYPVYAASALAANSFARSSFAAAFPLFGVQSRFEMTGDTKEAKHVWLTAADGCVHGSVSPAGLPMGDDPARLPDGGDGPLPVSGSFFNGRPALVLERRCDVAHRAPAHAYECPLEHLTPIMAPSPALAAHYIPTAAAFWLTKPVAGKAAAHAKSKMEISRDYAGADQSTTEKKGEGKHHHCYRPAGLAVLAFTLVKRHSSSTPHFAVVVPLTSGACPPSTRESSQRPTGALNLYSLCTLFIAQPRPHFTFHRRNRVRANSDRRPPTWRTLDASFHPRLPAGNECFFNGGRTAAILARRGALEGPRPRIQVASSDRCSARTWTLGHERRPRIRALSLPALDHPSLGPYNMTSDAGEDAKSSLQSQSPDENGDADMAEMAEHGGNGTKGSTPSQSGNGQAKSTANAKDPTRPRRKKARRACYACQRAHLTCGDERPCQRCIKRGLQDACHDGVRKKAKYLHDAPNEALMPGMGLRGAVGNQMHYLANLGRTQQLPPDTSYQGPSANDIYVQQQAMPTAFQTYPPGGPQSAMGPPMTDGMIPSQPYSNQQSPISPHFSSGPNHQPSPMHSMAGALQQSSQANPSMMQAPFDGTVFDVHDAMQYSFDPSSFNFGNHYGALEFGMLGHMSSGAADTTPTEATTQMSQTSSTHYTTPGTIGSTGFGGSPTNAQSYFYPPGQNLAEWQNGAQSGLKPAHFDQEGHNQGVASSIGTAKQEAPDAYSICAAPSNFTPPSDTSSTQGGMMTGFDDGPTAPASYLGANPHQNMQDRAAQQRHPQRPNPSAPGLPARRARDASSVYESVKQPYSYTNGFHGLTAFLQRRFPPQKTLRIAKALASIRPSFISCTKTLNRDDLIFMEKCFQRTLWEYEDFINAYGTPTIVCRRTGEVAAVGKEFSLLTGWKKDVLLGKEPNLNVNTGGGASPPNPAASSRGYNTTRMPELPTLDNDGTRQQPVFLAELLDDDSTIAFYEDFARLAFGDSRGSVTTRCKLLKYRTKADLEPNSTLDNDLGSPFQQQPQTNRNNGRGDSGVYQLGDKDGKVECSYCWTVKRDVFDIPMLIVMNVRFPHYSYPPSLEERET
ncbi:MAG: hypothetical protein LQ341_004357, partial [Variospora aurantia]